MTAITTKQRSTRTIILITVSILTCMIIIGILFFVKSTGYGTGLYTHFGQASTAQSWELEGEQALTAGAFVRNGTIDGDTEELTVDSHCAAGSLVLHITQADYEQSVDITDADGMVIPLEGFSQDQGIKLTVEHTKVSNFGINVSW